jgi:chromosome segregation and condensation protein ScpB
MTETGCRDPRSVMRTDGRPRLQATVDRFGELYRLVNYRELPDFSALTASTS